MKTVLITGGSSGIGYEITKHFAQNGYKILWASLLEDELQAAKKQLQESIPDADIDYLTIDLSKPDAAQNTFNWTQKNNWEVDVLINNAAFGTYGFANDISMEKEVSMIQLNVLNLFKMTRLFLKVMLAKNKGTIINISSNTSFQPVPKMSAYAATKSFVKHYSQSLTEELKALKSSVKVITVCPSAIKDTPFKHTAKMEKVKTFEGLVATTRAEVAKDVWNGFIKGKTLIISGAKLRRLNGLQGMLPHALVQFLLRRELEEGE